MKIEVEEVDSCNRKIRLEIPKERYQEQVASQFSRLAGSIQLPGFRKGKVPRSLLEKQFGPEVKREALSRLVSESLADALEEKNLQAVSTPTLIDLQAEENSDITVSASVEVMPQITIGDYSSIEVPLKIVKVTDKDVEDVISYYRNNKAVMQAVTGRAAQKDDIPRIDFHSTIDGKPFEGSEAKDYVFALGRDYTVPGFDDHIVGMSVGDKKDFQLTFPAEYAKKDIAGKTAEFHVEMKEIRERILPELNDDFAKTADPRKNFQSVEDMRRRVREDLEIYERRQARKAAKTLLAEKLAEQHPIDVPESLVREQIRFMAEKKHEQDHPQGQKKHHHVHDEHCNHEHEEEEPISAEDEKTHRPEALKILQQELVVGKLSDDMKVEVGDPELHREISDYVRMVGGGDATALRKQWEKDGSIERLRARMRRDKTLEHLLDKVRLREEMVDRPVKMTNN